MISACVKPSGGADANHGRVISVHIRGRDFTAAATADGKERAIQHSGARIIPEPRQGGIQRPGCSIKSIHLPCGARRPLSTYGIQVFAQYSAAGKNQPRWQTEHFGPVYAIVSIAVRPIAAGVVASSRIQGSVQYAGHHAKGGRRQAMNLFPNGAVKPEDIGGARSGRLVRAAGNRIQVVAPNANRRAGAPADRGQPSHLRPIGAVEAIHVGSFSRVVTAHHIDLATVGCGPRQITAHRQTGGFGPVRSVKLVHIGLGAGAGPHAYRASHDI